MESDESAESDEEFTAAAEVEDGCEEYYQDGSLKTRNLSTLLTEDERQRDEELQAKMAKNASQRKE